MLNKILDLRLQSYGLWTFLTYQSLCIQFIACCLHLVVLFMPKYKLIRDIVYTSFAYPIGSIVVYSFWTIWITQGQEMIFPKIIEPYYPPWLNHVTHTIIVPINIAQAYITFHGYIKKGALLTFAYIFSYVIFSYYIRLRCGMFVYPFMNTASPISLLIYFGSTIFCTLAIHETGYFITGLFHLKKLRRFMV